MSFTVSIDAIKAGLVERIDLLVPALFPNARREGAGWWMGDVRGAPGHSLEIHRTGHRAGWWKDFANPNDRGDILTLVAAGACDGDVKTAIPWAIRYLGLGDLSEGQRREREREAERQRARVTAEREADLGAKRRAARGHFLSGVPIAGTPAEAYLAGRGIRLDALLRPPAALRFRPMRRPDTGREHPCLIAQVQDLATGTPLSLHRTWLDPDGRGGWCKAAMENPKRVFCDFGGGIIPLQRGGSDRSLREAPAGEWITISEGIEDGLSVALACPAQRVAAAVSLANIGALRPPARIGGIYIAGQNDDAAVARGQFEAARARLVAARVPSIVAWPPAGTKDWNDWLRAIQPPAAGDAEAVA